MLGEGEAHRVGVDAMEPFDRDGVVALGEESRALRRASLFDLLDARVAAGLRLHSPSEPVVATAEVRRLGHRPALARLHRLRLDSHWGQGSGSHG